MELDYFSVLPSSYLVSIEEEGVQCTDINDHGTMVTVEMFQVENFDAKIVVVNLDQMDDCMHSLRDVYPGHFDESLLFSQRNGLHSSMGAIYLQLNPLQTGIRNHSLIHSATRSLSLFLKKR